MEARPQWDWTPLETFMFAIFSCHASLSVAVVVKGMNLGNSDCFNASVSATVTQFDTNASYSTPHVATQN